MVTPVVCVNLFFVPAISLWVYYKLHNAKFVSSVRLLLQYAIFAAANVPLTKIGIVVIRGLLGKEIFIDSGYYTLLAILSAALLPVLLSKVREIYRNREKLLKTWKIRFEKRSMTYRQKLSISLFLVLLIVIAYIIRGPLEIYAGNTQDLDFRLNDFLPWLLAIGAVILAAASLLLALLPDGPFCLVSVFLLWFGVASWIQDLFLNEKLAEVNGSEMDWNSLGSMPQSNFLIWILLLAAVALLCIHFKDSWQSIARVTAGALCLIQMIAIVSVFLVLPERRGVRNAMGRNLSAENQMQLASEDNLIIFLFDTVSTSDFESMLKEYPEAGEIVKDFVYYDNVCSDYSNTFPSVPHFLTGNEWKAIHSINMIGEKIPVEGGNTYGSDGYIY